MPPEQFCRVVDELQHQPFFWQRHIGLPSAAGLESTRSTPSAQVNPGPRARRFLSSEVARIRPAAWLQICP